MEQDNIFPLENSMKKVYIHGNTTAEIERVRGYSGAIPSDILLKFISGRDRFTVVPDKFFLIVAIHSVTPNQSGIPNAGKKSGN